MGVIASIQTDRAYHLHDIFVVGHASISLDPNTRMDISIPLSIVMDIGIPVFWTVQLQTQQNFVTSFVFTPNEFIYNCNSDNKIVVPLYPHISPFPRFFRSIRTLKKRFY